MPTRPPTHQPPHGTAVQQRQLYDRWRGSPSSRGYDRAWQKLRLLKLKADPLCWWCSRRGHLTAAEVVDHIKPIADHPELRMEWSNLRSGCAACHNAHTAREMAAGRVGLRSSKP